MKCGSLWFSLCVLHGVSTLYAPAHTLTVTADAKPGGDGSAARPFARIQAAINAASADTTIVVQSGTYRERIRFVRSGNKDGWITLKAAQDARVVLSGKGMTVKDDFPLVHIKDVNYIRLQGFQIAHLGTKRRNQVPLGVLVEGACSDVALLDLDIHHIETTFRGKNGGNAHGLAVYGNHARVPVQNLMIDQVRVHHCRLGSSEAMVLNGNVERFVVQNCTVHDNNNIGIDFIGFERVCPSAALDQCRNGVCRNNRVYRIHTKGNPAYGKNDFSAAGIYIDGGKDIVVEKNTILDSDIGIEVASEHQGKSTSRITVRDNRIVNSWQAGIMVGGYSASKGAARKISIEGNILVNNDRAQWNLGEIALQFHVHDLIIRRNILHPLSQDGEGFCITRSSKRARPANLSIDGNVYAPRAPRLAWNVAPGRKVKSFRQWQGL